MIVCSTCRLALLQLLTDRQVSVLHCTIAKDPLVVKGLVGLTAARTHVHNWDQFVQRIIVVQLPQPFALWAFIKGKERRLLFFLRGASRIPPYDVHELTEKCLSFRNRCSFTIGSPRFHYLVGSKFSFIANKFQRCQELENMHVSVEH